MSPDLDIELKAQKKALRARITPDLGHLTDEDVAKQSDTAQKLILDLPEYRSAKSIAIYLNMPHGEGRTDLIERHALESGKQLFAPYTYSLSGVRAASERWSVMDFLQLRGSREGDDIELGMWEIPTFRRESLDGRANAMGCTGLSYGKDEGEGELDLIVVPAMAYDHGMRRLGHGKGFYDDFLTRFVQKGGRKKPFLLGLALTEQILPGDEVVPTTDWDWTVDAVAVGDGRLLTAPKAA